MERMILNIDSTIINVYNIACIFYIECVHVPRISLTAEYRYENRKLCFDIVVIFYRQQKPRKTHKTYRYIQCREKNSKFTRAPALQEYSEFAFVFTCCYTLVLLLIIKL